VHSCSPRTLHDECRNDMCVCLSVAVLVVVMVAKLMGLLVFFRFLFLLDQKMHNPPRLQVI